MMPINPRTSRSIRLVGAELKKFMRELVDKKTADNVAKTTITQAKKLIASGINPIDKGPRRFPEYKGASVLKEIRKATSSVKDRKLKAGAKRDVVRKLGSPNKFYPFSVQKEFPDKKARPVNLNLSGDMLKDMDYDIKKTNAGTNSIEVKYSSDLSRKKESGHREGVNGQPKRPSLPLVELKEQWSQSIQNVIRKLMQVRIAAKIIDENRRR